LRHRTAPERLMPHEPPLGFAQRLATQRKAMDTPFDGTSDETGLLQDPQVLRDCWLSGLETAAEITGTTRLTSSQNLNDRPPRTVGERMERPIE
jgi:hypothetical protein